MRSLLIKRIASGLAVAACLPASVAFAVTPAAPARPSSGEAAGQLAQGNSRENSAVLAARNLAPGDSRSASVTITNRSRAAARMVLSHHRLRQEPGRGGGKLASRLELRVDEMTAAPRTVYRGAAGSMPPQMLGKFAAGESRRYRFTASFTESGVSSAARSCSCDNAYMGASLSLNFRWRIG